MFWLAYTEPSATNENIFTAHQLEQKTIFVCHVDKLAYV